MKTAGHLYLILFLLPVISACNKDTSNETSRTPGYFVLAELNNNETPSLKAADTKKSSSFDFGDLKASKEFFFILVNGGDEPIFNITMKTDKSQFIIRPTQLKILPGGTLIKNAESAALIPILTLGITHGTNLNGVGYDDLLPMGVNASELTVSGQTLNNGDTVNISDSFDISVFALVMDLDMYEGTGKTNILKPTGYLSSNLGGLGFIRYYGVYEDSIISVKNTGNVDIDMAIGGSGDRFRHLTIPVTDSVTVSLEEFTNIIVLDSKGTITNNDRIQLGNDGKGYLAIIKDNHQ
jgi:hypothetical protein